MKVGDTVKVYGEIIAIDGSDNTVRIKGKYFYPFWVKKSEAIAVEPAELPAPKVDGWNDPSVHPNRFQPIRMRMADGTLRLGYRGNIAYAPIAGNYIPEQDCETVPGEYLAHICYADADIKSWKAVDAADYHTERPDNINDYICLMPDGVERIGWYESRENTGWSEGWHLLSKKTESWKSKASQKVLAWRKLQPGDQR